MISEFKSITLRQGFISLFVFLGSVSPGVLIIFHFDRELFISLDSFKLMILSLAISLPVVLLNMFVAPVHSEAHDLNEKKASSDQSNTEESEKISDPKAERNETLLSESMAAFWISAVILYLSLGVSFWNGATIKEFIVYIFIGQGISYLSSFGTHLSNKRKRKILTNTEDLGLPQGEEQ